MPNPKILAELMKGEGLLCQYCGYAGESPPKWFIVMDGQGQDRRQIMDTAGITGKVSLSQALCSAACRPSTRRVEGCYSKLRARLSGPQCSNAGIALISGAEQSERWVGGGRREGELLAQSRQGHSSCSPFSTSQRLRW